MHVGGEHTGELVEVDGAGVDGAAGEVARGGGVGLGVEVGVCLDGLGGSPESRDFRGVRVVEGWCGRRRWALRYGAVEVDRGASQTRGLAQHSKEVRAQVQPSRGRDQRQRIAREIARKTADCEGPIASSADATRGRALAVSWASDEQPPAGLAAGLVALDEPEPSAQRTRVSEPRAHVGHVGAAHGTLCRLAVVA